jgi:hypothetical protein
MREQWKTSPTEVPSLTIRTSKGLRSHRLEALTHRSPHLQCEPRLQCGAFVPRQGNLLCMGVRLSGRKTGLLFARFAEPQLSGTLEAPVARIQYRLLVGAEVFSGNIFPLPRSEYSGGNWAILILLLFELYGAVLATLVLGSALYHQISFSASTL